jgi:hypothetical protein
LPGVTVSVPAAGKNGITFKLAADRKTARPGSSGNIIIELVLTIKNGKRHKTIHRPLGYLPALPVIIQKTPK